jgi:hypothetical protein
VPDCYGSKVGVRLPPGALAGETLLRLDVHWLLPAWLFGAAALVLAIVYARVLRADPRATRRGPAVLLDTSFLLLELVLILAFGGYPFRLLMVAAVVLATLPASALGLFTQGRERRQIAMYIAIGFPVTLVLAVLVFVASNVPFF